jgi:hypothetical protein
LVTWSNFARINRPKSFFTVSKQPFHNREKGIRQYNFRATRSR